MADNVGSSLLPGGTKILWERVPESSTFSLGFFFATGSRLDPPEKAGLAHLVEHLVFKGTKAYTAASLARLVDRVGGDLNAWTDREEMAFTCTVPADAWPVAVEALTELCIHPTFPPEEFDREREVIRNEILATLDDPEELAYEEYLQGLSPGLWSRPVAGTEGSLDRITSEDPQEWWRLWGHPSGLTVAFCGGVDPVALVEALTFRIPETSTTAPASSGTVPQFKPGSLRRAVKATSQMVQVIGGFHFPVPANPREALVWQVFSMLWGETMSSRLFQSIREQKGLSYSVSSQIFDAENVWGLQHFASGSAQNASTLVTALDAETRRLLSEPPTSQEWDDAQAALRGGVILGSERTENRVGRLWRQFESYGLLTGTEQVSKQLSVPVSSQERASVLSILRSQTPSLWVWGRIPGRFVLPGWP